MKIPEAFLGELPTVERNLRPVIAEIKKSGKLPDEFKEGGINAAGQLIAIPRTRVMFHADVFLEKQQHFRLYLFCEQLENAGYFPDDREVFWPRADDLFDELVSYSWGILVLLSDTAYVPSFSRDRARAIRFFRRFVEEFEDYQEHKIIFECSWMSDLKGMAFWNYNCTSLFRLMMDAGVPDIYFFNRKDKQFSHSEILGWIGTYILDLHSDN